ncbi:hypothetical protein OG884_17665 [Streptosporangium sp. NBC_01755]|nr:MULTISPECIES: hypothetical protein [unclassified Streptosporangium]WSA25033.1 hypothetical protein OIE13_29500 [Streptosporangium sp. NBC_01810]WSD03636.1 hypothetical protein OG884_17665 [Streptosporangium sp. NBC_01755]
MERKASKKWQDLPERIAVEQMTTSHPAGGAPDLPTDLDSELRFILYGL